MTYMAAAVGGFPETETDSALEALKQRPVDLVHLARHTLGNRDLEREVLQIFTRQSVVYLDRIRRAKNGSERLMAAHTIKGSARGIGAWEVADLAEGLEGPAASAAQIAQLAAAVEKTNGFITALLDDQP